METQRVNLEGPIIHQVRNYSTLEVDNNRVNDVEPTVGAKDKGEQKEIGVKINELIKIVQIYDSMSLSDIELEKRRKERDALAKKLEIVESEAAIAEMSNKIKFLEIAKKKSTTMPKGNIDGGFDNADRNTSQVPISFLSSFSQKVDLNKPVGEASTSNTMDNANRNVPYQPKINLKRRPIQLEGIGRYVLMESLIFLTLSHKK